MNSYRVEYQTEDTPEGYIHIGYVDASDHDAAIHRYKTANITNGNGRKQHELKVLRCIECRPVDHDE